MTDTAVTFEAHEPDPTAGRPRIAIIAGRAGELHVHVGREDRSLWLFAIGPSGGDRGRIAIGARRAGEVRRWLAGEQSYLYGSGTRLEIRRAPDDGAPILHVTVAGWSRRWHLRLTEQVLDRLLGLLADWTAATEDQATPTPTSPERNP